MSLDEAIAEAPLAVPIQDAPAAPVRPSEMTGRRAGIFERDLTSSG